MKTVTANYGGLDFFLIWEDMAHKTGPLISPAMVKRFMIPYYERLIDTVRSCGIECVWLDTDGNADSLTDMFVGAGVNALCPFEIAAGMEPLTARKKYGRKLSIMGGIDKRAVIAGGDVMRAEVMRKVPELLEGGRVYPGDRSRDAAGYPVRKSLRIRGPSAGVGRKIRRGVIGRA